MTTENMRWGLGDINVDPGEVLLRLVNQSAIRAERYAIELEALVGESDKLRDALVRQAWGEFGPTGEYIRGLAQLEAQERDRCAHLAERAVRAGLAERQVRLAERQGALIASVFRAVLGDVRLGLSADQLSAAPMIISEQLEKVMIEGPSKPARRAKR